MIKKLYISFTDWFNQTFLWWFTTLFGRLGLLFSMAAFFLVFLTYYIFNWSVSDKDTIFDIQDAFLHLNFIDSWNDLEDTSKIRIELNNLKIKAFVYSLDADTLCENSQLIWSNAANKINLCNYSSYYDSYQMNDNDYGFFFNNEYLSFGEYELPEKDSPAVFVVQNNKKYLLITEIILFNDSSPLIPSIVMVGFFMLLLYLLIRRFLKPIHLMEKRIIALKKGDLSSKIIVSGNDELALLSTNLNALIAEVKNLLKQKERLLSEVSHELRTPLSKMRLMIALMPENDKTKKIDKQIQHLDSIITNILLSDKMSGAYANLDISKFLISKLLDESMQLSTNRNIVNLSKTDHYLSGDIIKLSVAIKNILDNIEKYAATKQPCEFDSIENENNIIITVQDFGPGIPKDLLNKITEPFTQGKKDRSKGFGLGLSICSKVILAHCGKFEISNNSLVSGTTFTIIIPKDLKHGKK